MNHAQHHPGPQLLERAGATDQTQGSQKGLLLPAEHDARRASRGSRRILVWASAAGLCIALLVVGEPLALAPLALALAGALAATLATPVAQGDGSPRPAPLSLVAALPAGVLLLAISALAVGLLGGALDLAMWTTRGPGALTLTVFLLLTGAVSWRRGGRIVLVGPDGPALAGAGLLGAVFCWVVGSQPFELWSRAMSTSTDFLRHLGMVRDVRAAGLVEAGAQTYPRTFHATVAWLSSALGLGADSQTLWRAAQPFVLTMLVLMLLAVMTIAGRAAAWLQEDRRWAAAAAVIAGCAFVQTAWFSTFLAFGNVMNMLVGLGLLVMLLAAIALGARSATSALMAGAAVAATANAWQLVLPVAALGCLPWVVAFFRRGLHDPRQWAVWTCMGLLTLNGLLGVGATSVGAAASSINATAATPTVSNLFAPDWWWFAGLGLSLVAAVVAFRQGARMWASAVIGMTSGVVVLTGYLLHVTGSSWDLMLYYPVKAMWTGLVVVIPAASVGAVVVLAPAWRVSQRGTRSGVVLRSVIIAVVVLALAGVAGRGAAFRPHVLAMRMDSDSVPNWSLAVIDAMRSTPVRPAAQEGAIIMGVVPSTNVESIVGGFVGMADYMAMEALSHVGFSDAAAAPVKLDLARRDMDAICQHLRTHPDSVRITGPNPAAGPGWLLESGCPAPVVRRERWLVLQTLPSWLDNSRWEDPSSWTYPTLAEVRALQRG